MSDSDCYPPYEAYATKLAAAITAHIALFTALKLPVPDFLTGLQTPPAAAKAGDAGNTGGGTSGNTGGGTSGNTGNTGTGADAGNAGGGTVGNAGTGGTT